MYAFLSLYADMFTTHLLFNAHIKESTERIHATVCLKWDPLTAMVL